MILKCPDCQKQYNIDESKIPAGAKQAKCKSCGKSIILRLGPEKSIKKCPKCGHESDEKQRNECPACGIVYAKFVSNKPKAPEVNVIPPQAQAVHPVKDTPEPRKITIPAWLIPAIIGLIVGYFTGREHVKYELRQTFKAAAEGVRKSFGTALGGIGSEKKAEPPPPKTQEPSPFSVVLNNKEFQEADFGVGIRDAIIFSVNFKNLTGKDIRAFDGKLIFTDLLDNIILSSGLAVNDPVSSGSQIEWNGEIVYNQFIDSHQRLRNADIKNIKITFNAEKILFSDGSVRDLE